MRNGIKTRLKVEPCRTGDAKILACDLFAGAGGFSLGAHLAGIQVAAAVEWDKYACRTYRSNLINTALGQKIETVEKMGSCSLPA